MDDLSERIRRFKPFDENEEASKQSFLQFTDAFRDNIYTRDNLIGHVCASAFIVNKERTKILMAFHNIYQSFGWLGGHADGDKDLGYVALKETKEESGLVTPRLLTSDFADIAVLHVIPHIKRGKFVPAHLHYTVTYIIEADEKEPIRIAENENSAIAWLGMNDYHQSVKEEHMLPIYDRLIEKLHHI